MLSSLELALVLLAASVVAVVVLRRLGLPPLMAQGWGRVLTFTLSTTHRLQPSPRLPAHAAAKAALLSLTRSAAFEAGPHGVTVNALALGHTETEHQDPDEHCADGTDRDE